MLDQYTSTGALYFTIDFCDGESIIDAYAVVTAETEYESESPDCPASCVYKINPEYTVHREHDGSEIGSNLLKDVEFIISTYTYDGSRCHWDNKVYKDFKTMLDENQLSIDWD